MSLGIKIQKLRKDAGFSQEQLADSLGVSRQAISKWELDQTLPEIDKLLALSKLFSVTTDSLLDNDEFPCKETITGKTNITGNIFHDMFSSFVSLLRRKDLKLYFHIFSILCFIAIGVCIIVNYSIDRSFTWSLYPIISVIFGWVVSIPIFFKKYVLSISIISLLTIPFLFVIDMITPIPSWFMGIGVPAAITGIVILWLTYLLFRYLKINLFYKFAISPCITGLVSNIIITHYVDAFCGSSSVLQNIINSFSYVLAAAILVFIGYTKRTKAMPK